MQPFEITIPIRPYLKKFIASYKCIEPFELSLNRCHISGILLESTKKDFKRVDLKETKELTEKFTFAMSSEIQKKNRFWMDERMVQIFDYRMKALFNQQLIDHVTMVNQQRGDIKKSILNFMEYYSITEDDLPWETVCKMYYRARHGVPSQKREKMEKVVQLEMNLFE